MVLIHTKQVHETVEEILFDCLKGVLLLSIRIVVVPTGKLCQMLRNEKAKGHKILVHQMWRGCVFIRMF